MTSAAQICNMSLSHLGSDARVASIYPPDGSVEAGHCATFYDLARTELLEPGNWAFSLKRTTLSPVDSHSRTWTYAYALPSDCLRALRVLREGALNVFSLEEDGPAATGDDSGADFTVEGEILYTHEPEASLVYSADVTDETKFPASFVSALSFNLAGYLAGPIVKGNEGAKLGDAMRARALDAAERSAVASANASSTYAPVQASVVTARR